MDHKVFNAPQRAFASLVRNTRSNFQPILSHLNAPKLQHPALSYPAEVDLIHESLDLSFQLGISVSHLDRQIIDNLNRSRGLRLATNY